MKLAIKANAQNQSIATLSNLGQPSDIATI